MAPAPRLQLTALRVRVVRPTGAPALPRDLVEPRDGVPEPVASRSAYFAEHGDFATTPVFDWPALAIGDRVDGPAVVQAPDTTVVVPPGWIAVLDRARNLGMHR